jgi:hypothetical protein
MPAVRTLFATLNDLAYGGVLARAWSWSRPASALGARLDGPSPWESRYAHAGVEPPLEELLLDPMVRLVMRADRLEQAEVRRLLGVQPPTAS